MEASFGFQTVKCSEDPPPYPPLPTRRVATMEKSRSVLQSAEHSTLAYIGTDQESETFWGCDGRLHVVRWMAHLECRL